MTTSSSVSTSRNQSLVNTAALLVGVVFLLVGILGFVPGVTTHYGDLQFMGHGSGSKLLGVFQVSILHNVVHLLFGVAGIAAGRASGASARGYLIGGGVVYLVLWVYGLVVGMGSKANFVPLNTADNWLHLLLGLGMIALGIALGRSVGSRVR
jgi:Domain of unknown function (DUF4383)